MVRRSRQQKIAGNIPSTARKKIVTNVAIQLSVLQSKVSEQGMAPLMVGVFSYFN